MRISIFTFRRWILKNKIEIKIKFPEKYKGTQRFVVSGMTMMNHLKYSWILKDEVQSGRVAQRAAVWFLFMIANSSPFHISLWAINCGPRSIRHIILWWQPLAHRLNPVTSNCSELNRVSIQLLVTNKSICVCFNQPTGANWFS